MPSFQEMWFCLRSTERLGIYSWELQSGRWQRDHVVRPGGRWHTTTTPTVECRRALSALVRVQPSRSRPAAMPGVQRAAMLLSVCELEDRGLASSASIFRAPSRAFTGASAQLAGRWTDAANQHRTLDDRYSLRAGPNGPALHRGRWQGERTLDRIRQIKS